MSFVMIVIGIIGVILICAAFIAVFSFLALLWQRWMEVKQGSQGNAEQQKSLTPTQKFILAASSPTVANNYKCVIDIWGTHESETGAARAIELFEWGWGECTYENAKNMVDKCLYDGLNTKFKSYCNADESPQEAEFTDFERGIMEEAKKKYPKQGMLGWDLVRVLSIVGGAYMGGTMEYREAAKIALDTCRLMQESFLSWDDMVGSYTLGYQFWRGKKKTDRLKYYKKLKKSSWIYNIAWETPLMESEL